MGSSWINQFYHSRIFDENIRPTDLSASHHREVTSLPIESRRLGIKYWKRSAFANRIMHNAHDSSLLGLHKFRNVCALACPLTVDNSTFLQIMWWPSASSKQSGCGHIDGAPQNHRILPVCSMKDLRVLVTRNRHNLILSSIQKIQSTG